MKISIRNIFLYLFAMLFVVGVAQAQAQAQDTQAAQQAQSNFSQPELDQMLAPIALYPDALLSQVLMASTYPTEIVEASFWLKANPELKGEEAVKAAENQQWDISVKSLLPFPQILSTMETKTEWTQNLGNAFLGQQQQVMDTIQSLRRKAMQAGYLKSDERVRVATEDQMVSISLVNPTTVYVPYYNPTVVYGTWSAPAYQPVYWDPWPGYTVHSGYGWAWAPAATIVTAGVLYGAFNWRSRHIYHHRYVNYWQRHHHYDHYRYRGSNSYWRHDPRHRRDVAYRGRTVSRRYENTARNYNRRVGHRPTVHDIRTGRHKPTRVTTTGRTGSAVTGGRTGGRPVSGATSRTGAATTGRHTGGRTGHSVTGGRTGSAVTGRTGGRTVSGATGRTGSTTTGRHTGGRTGHAVTGARTGSAVTGRTGGRTVSGATGRTGAATTSKTGAATTGRHTGGRAGHGVTGGRTGGRTVSGATGRSVNRTTPTTRTSRATHTTRTTRTTPTKRNVATKRTTTTRSVSRPSGTRTVKTTRTVRKAAGKPHSSR